MEPRRGILNWNLQDGHLKTSRSLLTKYAPPGQLVYSRPQIRALLTLESVLDYRVGTLDHQSYGGTLRHIAHGVNSNLKNISTKSIH